ncbi:MAG: hypothetical protein N2747_10930 [Chitinophagaceae bacterium]|nr:hypothetical protein [Chitinophagaceae bacterium]
MWFFIFLGLSSSRNAARHQFRLLRASVRLRRTTPPHPAASRLVYLLSPVFPIPFGDKKISEDE